jgi:hypothetical protein
MKSGVGKAWISLDSLVRIELFQWVTPEFSLEEISDALFRERSAGTRTSKFGREKRGIAHGDQLNSVSAFLQ